MVISEVAIETVGEVHRPAQPSLSMIFVLQHKVRNCSGCYSDLIYNLGASLRLICIHIHTQCCLNNHSSRLAEIVINDKLCDPVSYRENSLSH